MLVLVVVVVGGDGCGVRGNMMGICLLHQQPNHCALFSDKCRKRQNNFKPYYQHRRSNPIPYQLYQSTRVLHPSTATSVNIQCWYPLLFNPPRPYQHHHDAIYVWMIQFQHHHHLKHHHLEHHHLKHHADDISVCMSHHYHHLEHHHLQNQHLEHHADAISV